jgi:alkaline phosphatase
LPLRLKSSIALLLAMAAVVAAALVATRFFRAGATFEDLAISVPGTVSRVFPVPDSRSIGRTGQAELPVPPATDLAPRSIILVIGDGMGLGHLSAVSVLVRGPAGRLAVERAPVVGLVRTWAADTLVTDSAAAASAMATGLKTPESAVSQQPDGSTPITLLEAAAAAGMATGVVTTAGLADATPAAFLAHAGHREEYRTILEQLLASNATVLIGGDWRRSAKAARQPDYLELERDAEAVAGARFTVVRDASALASAPAPLLALLPARPGSRSAHGPPLAESTRRALELLGDRAAGFLLVVENEETDEAAHDNDVDATVAALAELDEALRVILEYAAARSDTLVVVTADHDTAGLAITHGDFNEGAAKLGWLDDGHLNTWVPLFAFGPGAGRFAGVLDNTEIGRRIAELLGFEGFPPAS